MCRDIVPVRASVLSAVRIRREGVVVHIHTAVAHRVLLATGRDHTAHIAHCAPAGQVFAVHHGAGHVVRFRHRGSVERELQVGVSTRESMDRDYGGGG